MMKIYIAGAITNNPNYRQQFKAAEERLVAAGHAVVNPCKNEGFTYREYINMGLCELMHCDAIYLLKGYDQSTGATLEHDYARTVGLVIMKEADEPTPELELDRLAKFLEYAESQKAGAEIHRNEVSLVLKLTERERAKEKIKTDYGLPLCPKCEREVNEHDEYCSWCGQRLL